MSACEIDFFYCVPKVLRLRAIYAQGLIAAVATIAAALAWPPALRLIGLAGLAATSLLFALAAGREWWLKNSLRRISRCPRAAGG